jgi:hypothetical protein
MNVAMGSCAGFTATVGRLNTLVGQNAGRDQTTACGNTFIGQAAGRSVTTGGYNTAVGNGALRIAAAGLYNTAVGVNAAGCATGTANIAIGYYANTTFNAFDNTVVIGTNSPALGFAPLPGLASNFIHMGNLAHTCACINIPWTPVSDERRKKIKGPVPLGLDFVTALEPIEFQFMNPETKEVTDETYRYGFSAQKVIALEVDPEKPVIGGGSAETSYSLTNDYMVPTLVNAIQELSKELKEIKTRISTLEGET